MWSIIEKVLPFPRSPLRDYFCDSNYQLMSILYLHFAEHLHWCSCLDARFCESDDFGSRVTWSELRPTARNRSKIASFYTYKVPAGEVKEDRPPTWTPSSAGQGPWWTRSCVLHPPPCPRQIHMTHPPWFYHAGSVTFFFSSLRSFITFLVCRICPTVQRKR